MKYLFLAMGPGETSQARALAQYIRTQENEVTLAVSQAENISFLEADHGQIQVLLTETPAKLYQVLRETQPDVLIFCNSKAWIHENQFRATPPSPKPLTICLDSNWLFNEELYPFFPPLKWSDRYLVNIPPEIYEFGLQEHGGGFVIPPETKEKITPVGFTPSYEPLTPAIKENIRQTLGVQNGEKLIFLYGSGWGGADYRGWIVDNLRAALASLKNSMKKIKILYVGPTSSEIAQLKEVVTVIESEKITAEKFFQVLGSSDLVFQHQGLATLAQAVSAQVPIIANIAVPAYDKLPEIHQWEVEPFARSGVCRLHTRTDNPKEIASSMEQLLFNETVRQHMQAAQKKYSQKKGEREAYQVIQKLLIARRKIFISVS